MHLRSNRVRDGSHYRLTSGRAIMFSLVARGNCVLGINRCVFVRSCRMVSKRTVSAVVAVADSLSFRVAAGHLGLSQPALTRLIQGHEGEVG
ncbi:MAG: helix-turn-helix domain-containing protein, partial [Hyphomicrobiales bacterium]